MRLLLINPRFPESFWSFQWTLDNVFREKRSMNPPLGLATLAALCPPAWQITICDENIEQLPEDPEVDLVGVCGMGVQFQRQQEILNRFRLRGYYVVAGGSYASLCPEHYEPLANTVVAGEAEYIWKEFCRDFESGTPKPLYRESGAVDLADSPTPRFDLLQLDKYWACSLQFSRGCPYRCEFCDIIIMFGRKPRFKTNAQIEAELDRLREQGACRLFFVDDNFIGNQKAAKELLKFLVEYQRKHGFPFRFGTEASINLAQDAELLELFKAAGFGWVFIGIESPDPESLKETKKFQNIREDVLSSVKRIHSYGLDIYAGFIIGFDNDSLASFNKQFEFIMDSGIQVCVISLLSAIPKTPLYERLKGEGRLRSGAHDHIGTKFGTNIVPKQMSYDSMVHAYGRLYQELYTDRNISKRVLSKRKVFGDPCHSSAGSFFYGLRLLARLVLRGVLPGGISRILCFLKSIPWTSPRAYYTVFVEWAIALAIRDYAERHLCDSGRCPPARPPA